MTQVLLPVIESHSIRAWPKHARGGRAVYMPIDEALTRSFSTDAHTCLYSAARIERRLSKAALEDPAARAELGPVEMVAVLFDVDAWMAHKATGGRSVVAPDAWWLAELERIEVLLTEHPRGFVYRTRGGYRIVYVLAEPVVLRDGADADAWSSRYLQWVAYLRRRFSIVADPGCREWVRLFRLPHATRLDEPSPNETEAERAAREERNRAARPQQRETVGDPRQLGAWSCVPTEADADVARSLARRPSKGPTAKRAVLPASTYAGPGVLHHAFLARGWLGHEIEPGKHEVRCPRAEEHSKSQDLDGSTVLFAPGHGEELGWIHCSHTSHGHDRWTLRQVLAFFTEEELQQARGRAGLLSRSGSGDCGHAREERRTIQLGPELHRIVDEAAVALVTDGDVYQREGTLVRVVRVADAEADDMSVAGTPQIRSVTAATLRERLTRHAVWERFDRRTQDWTQSLPSDPVVHALLARGAWDGVRPLVGVIEAPSMRPDGTVIDVPGYDVATGYLYVPNAHFPAVAASPTLHDARRALADLAEVFCDFPYRSAADRAVPIATLLTLLGRPAIRGSTPAFLFDASTRGVGKTMQADAVSLIATGRTTAKMSYPADEAELEKVLGAYALRGAALVNFDNVTRLFGGGPLDRCLTAEDAVELRVLGKSEIPTLRWRAVIVATGNNITLSGDTARRVLLCRLRSELENPEDRSEFRHTPLLDWVRAERPRLVCAALTLLRAFVLAGRPGLRRRWGSFERWTATIPAAIVFAGGADPLDARPSADGDADPERQALTAILDGWRRLDSGAGGLTVKAAIDALYSAERLRGQAPPDSFDELREAIESLVPTQPGKPPSHVKLSYRLRRFRERVLNGTRLETRPGRAGTARWTVVGLGGGDGGDDGHVSAPVPEDASSEVSLRQFSRGVPETSPPSPPSPPSVIPRETQLSAAPRPRELLAGLRARGLRLCVKDGRVIVLGTAGTVTESVRQTVAANEAGLLLELASDGLRDLSV